MWISSDKDNLGRVYRALARFGAPSHIMAALEHLAPDEILFMGVPPVRVDLLQNVSGLEFAPAFGRRVDVEWDGVPVTVIGLDDLIVSKRAAGRPQDLLDAEELERVRNPD